MSNPEIQAQYVANEGRKLAPKPKRQPSKPERTKGLRQESFKHKLDAARWSGIREATIYWLNRLDPDGARCFECGRKARTLDLDHVVPRSRNGRSTVGNSQLLCRPCHEAKHRNQPEWTKEGAR